MGRMMLSSIFRQPHETGEMRTLDQPLAHREAQALPDGPQEPHTGDRVQPGRIGEVGIFNWCEMS